MSPEVPILAFALTLLAAVLVSELARRSVLSTAVLFLIAGFVGDRDLMGFVPVGRRSPIVEHLAELALFSVLFTDAMQINLRGLASAWRLPGRALLLGLPLTLGITALLARFLAGLTWVQAFLVGAILSPTDPVFVAAIVGNEEVPPGLRHLLNVESGLNDGLALPVVLALLASLGASEAALPALVGRLALGVALGIAVPWVVNLAERACFFGVARAYEPLFAVAVALVVLTVSRLLNANEYLAAFAAGVTLATVRPRLFEEFRCFGEPLVELFKLAALFVFAALISPHFLAEVSPGGYALAVLALVLARPAALVGALLGSELTWRERLVAAWFGPKGFASVVYGLLLVKADVPGANLMFHLVAVTVALSIVAHSSTDVVVARWFHHAEPTGDAHRDVSASQPSPAGGTG